MITRKIDIALGGAYLSALSLPAFAVPITYVYQGLGNGVLDQTTFLERVFTITALADTDNITPWVNAGGGPQNTHDRCLLVPSFRIHERSRRAVMHYSSQ